MFQTANTLAAINRRKGRRAAQVRTAGRYSSHRIAAIEPLDSRVLLSAYYVSAGGSGAAAGTASAPWKTLQKAANTVRPGDNVTVRAGNYAGFEMDGGGTSSARITFPAEPGTVINAGTSRGDGINLEGAGYVTIEGFKVVGVSHAGI